MCFIISLDTRLSYFILLRFALYLFALTILCVSGSSLLKCLTGGAPAHTGASSFATLFVGQRSYPQVLEFSNFLCAIISSLIPYLYSSLFWATVLGYSVYLPYTILFRMFCLRAIRFANLRASVHTPFFFFFFSVLLTDYAVSPLGFISIAPTSSPVFNLIP